MYQRDDLLHHVVKFRDDSRKAVGTGIVVAANVVATCAHVVTRLGSGPGSSVMVTWRGTDRAGRVDEASWRDENEGDLALVRLDQPLPLATGALPMDSWRADRPSRVLAYGFPDQPGRWLMSDLIDETDADRAGIRFLQGRSTEVAPGFSGAPLWDEGRTCVVGMVRARDGNQLFALSVDMIAELLCGSKEGPCQDVVAEIIERVSARTLPRVAWPESISTSQLPAQLDLVAEAERRIRQWIGGDTVLLRRLLLRLPRISGAAPVRDDSVGGPALDVVGTVIEHLARVPGGLPLLVAALVDAGADVASLHELDQRVTRECSRLHSEGELRSVMTRLREAGIDAQHVVGLARRHAPHAVPPPQLDGAVLVDWVVRAVAVARPSRADARPLDELVAVALGGRPPHEPYVPATAAHDGESHMVVTIECAGDGHSCRIWGTTGGRCLKLHDDESAIATIETIQQAFDKTFGDFTARGTPMAELTVEFVLPQALILLDVENWRVRSGRTRHRLAEVCRVTVRSWERLYDGALRSTWASWQRRWEQRRRPLKWLDGTLPDAGEALFTEVAQPEVSCVGFCCLPQPPPGEDVDAVSICVDAGVPVVVWPRRPTDGHTLKTTIDSASSDGAAVDSLPEAVRRERYRAGTPTAVCGGAVALLWDPPDRLPPDLQFARPGIRRRSA